MLLRRGARQLIWLPAWFPVEIVGVLGFAAFVWQRWGGLLALAVLALPIVPGLLFGRWIAVREGRVFAGGVLSRGSVPCATARLEVRLSAAQRGGSWVDVVDSATGERVPAWSTLTAVGAVRAMERVGAALDIPVRQPAFDLEQARRGAWVIGGILGLCVAILVGAFLYLQLRAATLTVTLQPGGEVELDGERLTLDEQLEPPRGPGLTTEVEVGPGPHAIAFRGGNENGWVRTQLTVEPHQPYRLWVSFERGEALLLGPNKLRRELPVSQNAAQ
jgi:hypothetical protein